MKYDILCGIMKTNGILFSSLLALLAVAGCASSTVVSTSGTDFAEKALAQYVEKGELPGAISIFYKDGVQEVYDYIIHDFLVYDKENFSPEIIYQGQTISLEEYPQDITYADMTGIQDDKEKERLLALWKY
jgi:hypothetical protein